MTGILLLIAISPATAKTSPAQVSKPNVLIIVADDLAAHMTGIGRHPTIRTPNIDRLAKRGLWLRNSYANSPVCTASRQSLLTGRLPQEIGVTQLKTALPEETVTLAELFGAAGYRTAALGKMHFNSRKSHGFDLLKDKPEHVAYLREHPARIPTGDVAVLPAWRPFKDPARVWLNSMVLPYPAYDQDMLSTWIAGQADKVMSEKSDKPLFLMVSFTEPHSPFQFPIEYAGRIDPAMQSVPPVAADDQPQIPAIFRNLTPAEKQGIRAAYETSVEFLDRNVGRVLDSLKASGKENETIVVFLGDHGYMLGEHGRFEKHCFYEPAVRAPVIISLPNASATESNALVELIDLAPTLLELCAVPGTTSGKSLVPLLHGKTKAHRDHVFSLYTENEEAMVRDARYKYIYTTGRREREDGYKTGLPLSGPTKKLYDLTADPEEKNNLAKSANYGSTLEQLEQQLYDRLVPTHRSHKQMPTGLNRAQAIDWCLVPRDVVSAPSSAP